MAGFEVVVLEQGPYRTAADFGHDELRNFMHGDLTDHPLVGQIRRPSASGTKPIPLKRLSPA